MKTHGSLWAQVTAFQNLCEAARKAALGKRHQPEVADFLLHLETHLFRLQEEFRARTYVPGAYYAFWITDPKPRLISAAPFRDRVVHHALMNVVAPLLERRLIYDCWANRKGKGTHRAIDRFQGFCREYRYCLKCDDGHFRVTPFRKYFPSIDHEIQNSCQVGFELDIECHATGPIVPWPPGGVFRRRTRRPVRNTRRV